MSKKEARARILILSLWQAPYRLTRKDGEYQITLTTELEKKLLISLGA